MLKRRKAAISWDDLERTSHRASQALQAVEELEATVNALKFEWLEMADRIERGWRRLEAAERRAEAREGPPPSEQTDLLADVDLEATDPFTRKLIEVRRQGGAIPSGADESTG